MQAYRSGVQDPNTIISRQEIGYGDTRPAEPPWGNEPEKHSNSANQLGLARLVLRNRSDPDLRHACPRFVTLHKTTIHPPMKSTD